MKLRFIEVETAIKIKLSSILEQLNQRHSQREPVIDYENDEYFSDTAEEKALSTEFLQKQKNQLIDLQEHFERYCNTLPVFGFNNAQYDINLIKSYLLPILVNEQQNERTVIKKANQIVSFKFGDVQLLDTMNFLDGGFSLDSYVKAYKTEETIFSPMSGSTIPKSWTTKNYLLTIFSLADCVILILSKKVTTTLKTSLLAVYRQSKQYASYE